MNKHRMMQYIGIAFILTVAAGGYFYFQSNAAQKINSSKVNNLTSGLVGYWTFDGADMTATQAYDMSTNDNHGTINGSITRVNGKIGQGLHFDGSTTYLDVGSPNLGIDNYTICAWISPSVLPSGQASIFHYRNSADGINVGFRIWSSGIMQIFDENTDPPNFTTALAVNNWYHVCAAVVPAVGNAAYSYYLNGNLDKYSAAGGYNPYLSDPDKLTIGTRASIPAAKFNGKIDEVRIYNRALSQSEITELYQQGQTKINASQTNKLTSGLIGYWPMDGNYINWSDGSTEIKDASGYNGCGGSPCHANALNISQTTGVKIGKIGQALDFNAATGANDQVDLGGANVITVSNSFTVSMWIFTSGGSDDYGTLIAKDGNGPGIWYRGAAAGANQNKITYYYDGDHHSNALSTGTWHHVVARNNAGTFNFYIDGVIDPNTYTGAPGITDLRYIGEDDGSEDFKGQIDEVRIYNRALSQSEITELYQQGQTKINASQAGRLTNGLVVHQTFDGNNMDWSQVAAEARDVSGNSNHGDVVNMTNTKAVIGKFGQGLNFDGAGDYVNMGDVNALDGQSYLTLSAWVKLNATGPYDEIIGKTLDYLNGFNMTMDNDTYPWAVAVGIGNAGVNGSYNLTPSLSLTSSIGSWHLWTMVFDGTQTGNSNRLKFYYDGVQQTLEFYADNVPASTPAVASNFYIGKNTNQAPNAVIDEVRIYNRALSQSEVTELYNMGR